jgi:hypothetical protein
MCNNGYVEYDAETGEARQCGNPRCPDNRVRPTPPSRGLPIPAPHDEFPCRLSQKEPRASKFVNYIQMAVIQSNATPVSVALLTPKQSKPLRRRWILRGRKRFWIALRQTKTPQPQQPQYRPPFHPFDAHAHGSAACRARSCCDAWTSANNVLRAACTFRNRAVSVIARHQAHAGRFDRPAGGSFSCRGPVREKPEDNTRRRER